jgi:hypothetical protein
LTRDGLKDFTKVVGGKWAKEHVFKEPVVIDGGAGIFLGQLFNYFNECETIARLLNFTAAPE